MKKANKLMSSLLLSTLVLGSVATASLTKAVEVGTYKSKGKVTFTEGNTGVDPLDPENPDIDKPVDPVNPVDPQQPITPSAGPLSIDFASSFDFGTADLGQKLDPNKTTVSLKAAGQKLAGDTKIHPNYVQVTDHRGLNNGLPKGWKLKATLTKQFSFTNKTITGEIAGATLSFNGATIENEASNTSTTPAIVSSQFDLSLNQGAYVISAAAGEGWGTWTYHFGTEKTAAESVLLNIPKKQWKTLMPDEDYQAEITWAIEDI